MDGIIRTSNRLTPEDAITCRLIGLLMAMAKTVAQAQSNAFHPDVNEAAKRSANDYRALMRTAIELFPAGDLEPQVIAFAKRMGFVIEQIQMAPGSTAKN